MRQLTCEMCGGTELMKQDGVFICQTCGTKYSVEEAKKMMIEGTVEVAGTVRVDSAVELDNLYILARRARDENNDEDAAKFYDQILLKDPNSWEAAFYAQYYKTLNCKLVDASDSFAKLTKRALSTLDIICSADMVDEEKRSAILMVMYRITTMCGTMMSSIGHTTTDFKLLNQHCSNIAYDTFGFLEKVEQYINIDDKSTYIDALKIFEHDCKRLYITVTPNNKDRFELEVANLEKKIKMFDPDFESETLKIIAKRNSLETKKETERIMAEATKSIQQKNQKSGGCYVATAVYGSYDCPQVWTLRRYRDNILAENWYGRAFIRTYYAISPTLVKWFGHTDWFKNMWRGKLDRMVSDLQSKGVESTPYEDREW